MDIVDLPHDLFLLVIAHFSPRDVICCRGVSRKWSHAFTNSELSLTLLRWHFPRCRELRLAASAASYRTAVVAGEPGLPAPEDLDVELQLELERGGDGGSTDGNGRGRDWAPVFAEVARRYHHLRTATPAATEKIETQRSKWKFFGVGPWNRYLRLDDKTAPFHYADPRWAYSQEDGVLVYQSVPPPEDDKTQHDGLMPAEQRRSRNDVAVAAHGYINDTDKYGHPFRVLDLATRHEYRVPFHSSDKIVRRVRLAEGLLIFEWCEELPYHELNDREAVHRHYATAFDVVRERAVPEQDIHQQPSSKTESAGGIRPKDKTWQLPGAEQERSKADMAPPQWHWKITFRSEWKLHFLGLPLNRIDRFFSAHTATHYALYIWQPNRSPWGEDDPIELLTVWDISSPSPYKPSEDPAGRHRPDDLVLNISLPGLRTQKPTTQTEGKPQKVSGGPRLLRKMTWRDLEHYGIRQRTTPKLRSLALDRYNVYIVEEEHRWAQGQHSSLTPPRVHQVKSTAIPVIPGPPCQSTERSSPNSPDKPEFGPGEEEEPAATSLHPLFHQRGTTEAEDGATQIPAAAAATNVGGGGGGGSNNHINGAYRPLPSPVQGPRWVDECGADGDVNMSFCWRAQWISTARTPDGMAANAIPLTREQAAWSQTRGAQRCTDETFTAPFAAAGSDHARGGASLPSTLSTPGIWGSASPGVASATSGGASIAETDSAVRASPSRWPGWAPCWRHEDFPYLTVSEMVDFGAGVRVTARHCFMLETLSVHIRPAICVKGVVGDGLASNYDLARQSNSNRAVIHNGQPDHESGCAASKASPVAGGGDRRPLGKGGPRGQEVQFPDEMWDELLSKGFICGDERWIVGEDKEGRITVVRF